ncbi:MAG: hypothetical protein H7839_23040 [Magnetococcus sp. YQC-5]
MSRKYSEYTVKVMRNAVLEAGRVATRANEQEINLLSAVVAASDQTGQRNTDAQVLAVWEDAVQKVLVAFDEMHTNLHAIDIASDPFGDRENRRAGNRPPWAIMNGEDTASPQPIGDVADNIDDELFQAVEEAEELERYQRAKVVLENFIKNLEGLAGDGRRSKDAIKALMQECEHGLSTSGWHADPMKLGLLVGALVSLGGKLISYDDASMDLDYEGELIVFSFDMRVDHCVSGGHSDGGTPQYMTAAEFCKREGIHATPEFVSNLDMLAAQKCRERGIPIVVVQARH